MEKEVIDVTKVSGKFEKNDCVYIVNNVIDLSGGTFEVSGANCILRFTENGQIMNGTIKLNNVYIDAPSYPIFYSIVNVNGDDITITNEAIKVEWFRLPDAVDDTEALQLCIDIASNRGNIIQLLAKTYHVSSTLNIYSGTVIEGTHRGSRSGNYVGGSRIETNINDNTSVFLFYTPNEATVKTTCNKFRLSNLAIAKANSNGNVLACSALKFDSDDTHVSPRMGEVTNMYISGFQKAIEVKALSYVKFDNIIIDTCSSGVVLAKEDNRTLEFGWFHRIIINNGSMPAEAVVEGITLNSGNNLYFDEIDINDCNIGFNFNSKKDLFAVFVNRLNAIRCNTCVQFFMEQAHITRVKMSEMTLKSGACKRSSDAYATNNMYYGLLFKTSDNKIMSWCSFTDIYDISSEANSQSICNDYEKLSLNTCNFERVRVGKPMQGVSNVHKLSVFTFKPYGEVTFAATEVNDDPLGLGQFVVRTVTKELYDGILFAEPITITPIVIPIGSSPIPNSVNIFNDYENNKTKMTITIGGTNSRSYTYQYFFPTMI